MKLSMPELKEILKAHHLHCTEIDEGALLCDDGELCFRVIWSFSFGGYRWLSGVAHIDSWLRQLQSDE